MQQAIIWANVDQYHVYGRTVSLGGIELKMGYVRENKVA